MDPRSELPPGLRPPAGGDRLTITWTADLGRSLRVGELASHLSDLDTAVSLGERWGVELARVAAYQLLLNRILREGPRATGEIADRLGYGPRERSYLDEWIHTGWWPRGARPGRFPHPDPTTLLQSAADIEMADLLGPGPRVSRATYDNPIEVILGGSGLVLAGVASVLRLVRDWSNKKRHGAAEADRAEAEARERHARADEGEARAELTRWLVDEAKAGRIPIPIGELLQRITPSDETAVARLADRRIELGLPAGLDPSSD